MTATGAPTPLDAPLGGELLIEASAGTGKTYALTTLIARLLVESEHTIDRLVVVTFTNAAAGELRDRIRRTLRGALVALSGRNDRAPGDQAKELIARWELAGIDKEDAARRISDALRDFDRANVSTIHGFCQRVLGEFAFDGDVPFGFEVGGDAGQQVAAAMRDVWRRYMVNAHEELVRHARASKIDVDALAEWVAGLHAQSDLDIRGGNATPPVMEERLRAARDTERKVFDKARKHWESKGGAFQQALKSPPWNGNSLKKIKRLWDGVKAAFEDGDAAKITNEDIEYLRTDSLKTKLRKGESLPATAMIAHFDRVAEAAAASVEAREDWLRGLHRQALDEVREALRQGVWKDRQLSFDALLVELERALDKRGDALAERIRDRYPFALIDEFQDTDRIQADIFERIYGAGAALGGDEDSAKPPRGLVVVGDPKQSIYRFRGADIFAYLNASARVPDERKLSLLSNYRSTPALVQAVNALFDRRADPFRLPDIELPEVQAAKAEKGGQKKRLWIEGEDSAAPMRLRLCMREDGEAWSKSDFTDIAAARAAADIAELLALAEVGKAAIAVGGDGEQNAERRQLEGSDIAVLVRTGDQGSRVAAQLRWRGVGSVEIGNESVFATPEAEQLHRLLAALANAPSAPQEAGRLRGALSADLFDFDLADLAELKDDDEFWGTWRQHAEDWQRDWKEHGVATLIRKLLFAEPVRGADALLRYHDGPRRLTNTLHLTELLQQAEVGERFSPTGLVEWLGQSCAEASGGEEALLRLQSDEKLVRVLTVHKSKGLEFPVVFCPYAWDGRKPKERNTVLYHEPHEDAKAHRPVLDLAPGDDVRARAQQEEASEELRLLYVALTRAQYRCVVTWPFVNQMEHAPLAWLLHGEVAEQSEDRQVAALSEDQWREDVKAVVEEHPDDIQETCFDADAVPGWQAGPLGAQKSGASDLVARALGRTLRRHRQMSSYSALVDEAGAAVSVDQHREVERPDHDQRAHSEEERPEPLDDPPEAAKTATGFTPFAFPRGRHAGNCLHDIFQRLAERNSASDQEHENDEKMIRERLERVRIDTKWANVARQIVDTARSTPLLCAESATPLVLADLQDPVAEMEFHLPAPDLDRTELGKCLAEHGYHDPFASLAAADAAAERINGFLHGYIDLVACHENRFYVVDYKSNWLGATPADYSKDKVDAAMRDHDYSLQYLLYLTALHRHLRQRLPGYDYDRHMGGAFYLFVRGMSPNRPGYSIHHDLPCRACIEAIDACLRGDAAEGS